MSSRWDPLRDISGFRDAMNNLFDEGMLVPRGSMSATGSIPLDVRETRDRYFITAPLPGVSPTDVDISVLGSSVRISGEIKDRDGQQEQESNGDCRWLLRERRFGRFERSITLPTSVNSQHASAEFDAGVLTIELPKVEEAQPKTIQIKTVTQP
ncbi:MAG: Hsp20/alpha crystallin family protein [Nitrolancea sp.]